jgi:hypothetical protein
MKTQVLRGSKREIAEKLSRIDGEVREAIVFVDEPAPESQRAETQDIFAEMQPYMLDVPRADDSREAIYARVDGE